MIKRAYFDICLVDHSFFFFQNLENSESYAEIWLDWMIERQLLHSDMTKTEMYIIVTSVNWRFYNGALSSLKAFIIERGNPFQNKGTDMKNFFNQIQSSSCVAQRILSVFQKGKAMVNMLCQYICIKRCSLYHVRLTLNNVQKIDNHRKFINTSYRINV